MFIFSRFFVSCCAALIGITVVEAAHRVVPIDEERPPLRDALKSMRASNEYATLALAFIAPAQVKAEAKKGAAEKLFYGAGSILMKKEFLVVPAPRGFALPGETDAEKLKVKKEDRSIKREYVKQLLNKYPLVEKTKRFLDLIELDAAQDAEEWQTVTGKICAILLSKDGEFDAIKESFEGQLKEENNLHLFVQHLSVDSVCKGSLLKLLRDNAPNQVKERANKATLKLLAKWEDLQSAVTWRSFAGSATTITLGLFAIPYTVYTAGSDTSIQWGKSIPTFWNTTDINGNGTNATNVTLEMANTTLFNTYKQSGSSDWPVAGAITVAVMSVTQGGAQLLHDISLWWVHHKMDTPLNFLALYLSGFSEDSFDSVTELAASTLVRAVNRKTHFMGGYGANFIVEVIESIRKKTELL